MKTHPFSLQTSARLFILLLVSIFCGGLVMAAVKTPREKPPVPDFTQGGKRDENHDWRLGATGARGWVFGWKGNTSDSRQILITEVTKDSPADGMLKNGDVILGVGEKPFDGDARIQFAKAITKTEEEKEAGLLKLIRWRDGRTDKIELKLPAMGMYSQTSPYDCPKSKRIFESGCRNIAEKGLSEVSIPNDLNALALLASGKKEYRETLAAYARKAADLKSNDGMQSWIYGFTILYLGEYVAATQDRSVIDGLRRLCIEVAEGQSSVGTWGHGFASPSGNCTGYGSMNAPGILLTLGLVIAREAGVKEPVVDKAIAKSANFLRWYVNKGAVPYGDHAPWPGHEDNGKCSNAAMLFNLLGDREAATYFTKMSTAGYAERERGHTGNFFNILWAVPGVACGGSLATGAYWMEQSWYYDLARGHDGSFVYQGSPAGEEEHGKYTDWDCTGAYLLTYALPLKSLYLNGKKPGVVPELDAAEVEEVIAAGRDYSSATRNTCYDGRKTEQLLAGLSSWSPAVRKRSAQALGRRDGNFVPTLTQMLSSTNTNARYGACEALGLQGPKADGAAPQLRSLLKDPDPWIRSLACMALPYLGPEARKDSVTDLLRVTTNENPADPRGMAARAASIALFSPPSGSGGPPGILSQSLDGVDRGLLYPAVRALMENQDGAARGSLGPVYNKLTDQDLVALMPFIVKAIKELAPSNEMFGDVVRLAGLDLLSRLRIREGMSLCVSVIEPGRWGNKRRLTMCTEYLRRYGVHAKEVLPELREMRREMGDPNERTALLEKAITDIEASKDSPQLVTLKDFADYQTMRNAK